MNELVVTQAALKVCRDSRTVKGAAEMTHTVGKVAGYLILNQGGACLGAYAGITATETALTAGLGAAVVEGAGMAGMACFGGAMLVGVAGALGGAALLSAAYDKTFNDNDEAGNMQASFYETLGVNWVHRNFLNDNDEAGNMQASFYDTLRSMIPASIALSPMQTVQMKSSPEIDLCGALSSMIYCVQSKEELDVQLQTHYGKRPEMLTFSSVIYGNMDKFYQPAAVVVYGRTMFIAWRGTQTLLDMITDVNCTPQAAPLWHELCPEIKESKCTMGCTE
jgi:hypothetical protein